MRNETQLTPFDNGADNLDWQSPSPAAGKHAPKPNDTYRRIRQMLRGRYMFVLPLGFVLAVIGGIIGYKSQKPIYESVGMISVKTEIESPLGGESKVFYLYEEFLENQVLVMNSRTVIDKAMLDKDWLSLNRNNTPGSIKAFVDSMEVEHPPHSMSLTLTFQDRDPDAARIGAKAILDAYESVCHDLSVKEDAKQMEILEDFKRDLTNKYNDVDSRLVDESKEYGSTDLSQLYDNFLKQVGELEVQLTTARLQLDIAQKKVDPDDAIKGMNYRQIAMLDPHMRTLSDQADVADSQWKQMRARLGVNNPYLTPYQQALDDANKRMEDFAQDWRSVQLQLMHNPNGAGANGALFGITAAAAQQNVDSIQKIYDQTKAQMVTLGNKQQRMQRMASDKASYQHDLDDVDKRIDLRRREAGLSNLLERTAEPQAPYMPAKDRRIHVACIAGLTGFMLPMVILIFGALMDKRYRYSDEASEGIGQTPLLGILPTLPDKLDDPEQASIAAHCIHQIRIMLQMGRDEQNRRTFMLTSASTGDGKTSLALALGLSFAASGARTLLIDADIIGQGLSHRMRMSSFTGFCESILTGTMQGHVQKSINKGLWVLPIGHSDDFNAGMMSPVAIRKLIAEAKQHFDYILIDTGPALGSLEASLVALEVDNVILAVSRGQNQALVERTLEHLRGMGARIAGIVFNRAEKRDFHRSVVSSSIRSLSAKPSTPRGLLPDSEENARLGPLARSVVSFLPTTGQGDVQA